MSEWARAAHTHVLRGHLTRVSVCSGTPSQPPELPVGGSRPRGLGVTSE